MVLGLLLRDPVYQESAPDGEKRIPQIIPLTWAFKIKR